MGQFSCGSFGVTPGRPAKASQERALPRGQYSGHAITSLPIARTARITALPCATDLAAFQMLLRVPLRATFDRGPDRLDLFQEYLASTHHPFAVDPTTDSIFRLLKDSVNGSSSATDNLKAGWSIQTFPQRSQFYRGVHLSTPDRWAGMNLHKFSVHNTQ